MLLANKVAIVTGGAQGIGRATVERLAREGAKLVVADVNDDEGNKVVAAVKASGNEAVYRSADISERLDVYNLVAAARDAFGKVDILVNNAGTVDDQPFLELDEAEFDRQREAWRSYAQSSPALIKFWCAERSQFSPEFVSDFDDLLPRDAC